MAEPVTAAKISTHAAGFIKKYWHVIIILLFIIILTPILIFSAVINIFKLYKTLTEESGINWASLMAYDVARLDNYLKENSPGESILDFLIIDFKEYEIIETERQVTKTVDGMEITEIVTEKEYIVLRELEVNGYTSIKELLKSIEYDISEENMRAENVTSFLDDLNKEEEYETKTDVLSDEEISKDFDEKHKEWFFALIEILPLLDPTAEFYPDEFIMAEIIDNPDIPSIWPASGRVTSEFGEMRLTHIHRGIDIANITGTPVSAAASGTVIAVGSSGNMGKRIMIYHGTDENGNTYVTVYAHLSEFKVSAGKKVSQGDLIGWVIPA